MVLARTAQELQGMTCIELEEAQPDRQQIISFRSFGERLEAIEDLKTGGESLCQSCCGETAEPKASGWESQWFYP